LTTFQQMPDDHAPIHEDEGRRLLVVAGLLFLIFALVSAAVWRHHGPSALDGVGDHLLLPAGSALFRSFATRLRVFGTPVALVLAVLNLVLYALDRHRRARGIAIALAPVVAVLLGAVLVAPIVHRTGRPPFHLNNYFPSDHAAVVASVGAALALLVPGARRRAVAIAAVLVTAVMTWAVVAVHAHYLTDAVGGACFGAGTVVLVAALSVDPYRRRLAGRLRPRTANTTPTTRASTPGPASSDAATTSSRATL
jgi:membrane-associated phospholipid phosphatase